jgi:hypothetical protein
MKCAQIGTFYFLPFLLLLSIHVSNRAADMCPENEFCMWKLPQEDQETIAENSRYLLYWSIFLHSLLLVMYTKKPKE